MSSFASRRCGTEEGGVAPCQFFYLLVELYGSLLWSGMLLSFHSSCRRINLAVNFSGPIYIHPQSLTQTLKSRVHPRKLTNRYHFHDGPCNIVSPALKTMASFLGIIYVRSFQGLHNHHLKANGFSNLPTLWCQTFLAPEKKPMQLMVPSDISGVTMSPPRNGQKNQWGRGGAAFWRNCWQFWVGDWANHWVKDM